MNETDQILPFYLSEYVIISGNSYENALSKGYHPFNIVVLSDDLSRYEVIWTTKSADHFGIHLKLLNHQYVNFFDILSPRIYSIESDYPDYPDDPDYIIGSYSYNPSTDKVTLFTYNFNKKVWTTGSRLFITPSLKEVQIFLSESLDPWSNKKFFYRVRDI